MIIQFGQVLSDLYNDQHLEITYPITYQIKSHVILQMRDIAGVTRAGVLGTGRNSTFGFGFWTENSYPLKALSWIAIGY